MTRNVLKRRRLSSSSLWCVALFLSANVDTFPCASVVARNGAMNRAKLGQSLLQHYRDRRPGPDHSTFLEDLITRVRQNAAHASNKPQFEFFGSHKSGFCSKNADADMSFTFRSYNALFHGIPRFEEQNAKRMVRFSKTIAEGGMSQVKYVEARIPVVSFVDDATELQCDVSIGNVGGVRNSAILRLLHDAHPVVPVYIHTVKAWAKSKEVIAPEKSCFNSFTVTTMALMVLQELGVLPVFTIGSGNGGELQHSDVVAALSNWKFPAAYDNCVSDDDTMAEAIEFLLDRFANYYSAFDINAGTVSLMLPRRIRSLYADSAAHYLRVLADEKREAWEVFYKENNLGPVRSEDFDKAMRHEAVQRPHDSPVVVEDFVNYVNCGRRLTKARIQPVFAQFQELKDGLAKHAYADAAALYQTRNTLQRTHMDPVATSRVRKF